MLSISSSVEFGCSANQLFSCITIPIDNIENKQEKTDARTSFNYFFLLGLKKWQSWDLMEELGIGKERALHNLDNVSS